MDFRNGMYSQVWKNSVYCVMYSVCCVMYSVCCVLCSVCCTLCAVFCVLCAVLCVLCFVCCALCSVCCALCAVCCALCAVCCALCAVLSIQVYLLVKGERTSGVTRAPLETSPWKHHGGDDYRLDCLGIRSGC